MFNQDLKPSIQSNLPFLHTMQLNEIPVDKSWTLFLDRDGVINKKIDNDYVRRWEDFHFLDGSLDALTKLSQIFGRIVIITNQRGIAKGLYSANDLNTIHEQMLGEITKAGGRVDGIFFCPHLGDEPECDCRKPKPGMANQAKSKFPEIDFSKSVLVGDSLSDIVFGERLGMITVNITSSQILKNAMFHCVSLAEFAGKLQKT